jgi:ATP-dependent Zn protease
MNRYLPPLCVVLAFLTGCVDLDAKLNAKIASPDFNTHLITTISPVIDTKISAQATLTNQMSATIKAQADLIAKLQVDFSAQATLINTMQATFNTKITAQASAFNDAKVSLLAQNDQIKQEIGQMKNQYNGMFSGGGAIIAVVAIAFVTLLLAAAITVFVLWQKERGKVGSLGELVKLGKNDNLEAAGDRISGKVDDMAGPDQKNVLGVL